jgi:phosphoribosylglycinamide formyltransferase 1
MSGDGRLKLAVLISGRGSNLLAIAHACRERRLAARIVLVISDRADAAGLNAARELRLATAVIGAGTVADRSRFEAALLAAIDGSGAELVALAGFMRILSAAFVQHYLGRLLNVHPSLLPNYKGLHTHRRVLAAGEAEHGASVHFVTAELDGGPVIAQARVTVRAGDSEQELAARVIHEEHRIYPMVIGLIAAGRLRLQGAAVMLDGQPLASPLLEEPPHARG